MEKEDLELMREMLNDPEIENLVVGWAFPVSKYQQNQWYDNNITNDNNLRFIIETSQDGAIGLATLTDIDWKNRRAIHGIKLANKKNRTKGLGIDTVMAIMRYAFDELQLNRLDGSWFEDNIASQKLYTKCGWKVEGKHRQYIYKKGQYRDLVMVGVLKDEYEKLVKENSYWV
ncbi:N-acetyltransferase [Clostridium botulinum]|nr:N-acetyltransferase [Clostridium botulinum]